MPRGHDLSEGVKDAIGVLRAERGERGRDQSPAGMPKRTVSKYLQRVMGSGRGHVGSGRDARERGSWRSAPSYVRL
jgi:hypothetical protein